MSEPNQKERLMPKRPKAKADAAKRQPNLTDLPIGPQRSRLAWDELRGLKSGSAFTTRELLKWLKKWNPPARPKGQVFA
jgi:hypothetical protein